MKKTYEEWIAAFEKEPTEVLIYWLDDMRRIGLKLYGKDRVMAIKTVIASR